MARSEKAVVLHLSITEAEALRSYLEWTLKYGDDYDLDPKYEDWSWERTKNCMTNIAEQLPEAL